VKYALMLALSAAGLSVFGGFLAPLPARAVVCARGVYRVGCAGPNGAAIVRRAPVYHHGSPATVSCASAFGTARPRMAASAPTGSARSCMSSRANTANA
jgi:hypothetical protein